MVVQYLFRTIVSSLEVKHNKCVNLKYALIMTNLQGQSSILKQAPGLISIRHFVLNFMHSWLMRLIVCGRSQDHFDSV